MVARPSLDRSRARVPSSGWLLALGLALAPGAASCGKQADSSATPAATSPTESKGDAGPSATTPAPAGRRGGVTAASTTGDEPYASTEFGARHGTVSFEGEVPERFELGASQSNDCKHHPDVDQRSNVVVVEGQKLANAFVTLDSGYDRAQVPPAADGVVTLEQKGCMYVPRVLGLRAGQLLRVTNGDPTAHNVHTLPKRNAALNRTMGAEQPALEFRFEKPERPVPFKCDIHPWMGAAVFVEEHPWFAVTDAQGRFQIRDVPPGSYEVVAIHETLGKVKGTVSVKSGASTGIALTLSE